MLDVRPSQAVSILNPGDREMPHNREAEIAVLGSMLVDPRLAFEHAASKLKFEDSFFDPHHQTIFAAMLGIISDEGRESFDLITVTAALEKQGRLAEVGGRVYLAQLLGSVPSAANVEQYVDIVHQNAVLRRLIQTSVETIDRCYEAQADVRELVDGIEHRILEVTGVATGNPLRKIADMVHGAVDYLDKLSKGEDSVTGLSSGYDDLDRLITGFREGEMFVLAARPSIGKTALALNMAANIALGDKGSSVGIFSLEMPAEQLVLRMLCSEARIGLPEIREGALSHSKWEDVGAAGDRLHDSTIIIDDSGDIDILELKSKARRMKRDHDVQIIFIDYLQLIRGNGRGNQTRENEVAAMSGGIKAIAKELRIPIVVLAQLNRQAAQQGQRPKLSHLRESGAIEQDADVVALLHRDREKQLDKDKAKNGVEAELIVAKNRNGETGLVNLTFLPAYTRFESRSRISDDDVPDQM